MKVKWLGHACFLITSAGGLRIITDPYMPSGGINYKPINESADIISVSHDHGDHNNTAAVSGHPQVVKTTGTKEIQGVNIKGIATYHDEAKGKQRGNNIIFCFSLDNITLCHLGDLGHRPGQEELAQIGQIDVLLIPVGGFYTIDARAANEVCNMLKPGVVIPMHYKTDKCAYPIAGVEEFLKLRKSVRKLDSSEADLQAGKLPSGETLVLKHAL
jgi:L-ascorbate metabolism protein UlaG (beta-lactamase superfamily)